MSSVPAERQHAESVEERTVSEIQEAHPEQILGEPEPWESWETKLCLYSIGLGLLGLVILGVLVNLFILK